MRHGSRIREFRRLERLARVSLLLSFLKLDHALNTRPNPLQSFMAVDSVNVAAFAINL